MSSPAPPSESRTGTTPVRVVVSAEDPAAALSREAMPDDLLVVGTRGGGRLAGLVAASVARRLLDAPPCDVVVVPPEHTAFPHRAAVPQHAVTGKAPALAGAVSTRD